MDSQSKSKVALVTGGSRGIGAAVCVLLASRGFHVVVNYHKRQSSAQAVVDEILSSSGSAELVQADVSAEADVVRMIRDVKNAHGRIDVLVNNAGVTDDGYAVMMSLRKWSKVIDADLTGMFLCCREVSKVMIDFGGGSIVNVGSIAGIVGTAGQANYSAAKAGAIGLTKSLAAEISPRGVRVNMVVPGFIETDMIKTIPKSVLETHIASVPLGRVGSVQEAAAAVVWLSGDEASYITGTTLVVDGGLTRH